MRDNNDKYHTILFIKRPEYEHDNSAQIILTRKTSRENEHETRKQNYWQFQAQRSYVFRNE